MLGLTDLLKLHEVRNEAERFLKPWWDLLIDYLILALVMVAVVCGVVGLYAPGPVCVPVVNCPALGNSSLDKKTEICAMVPNTSENREDPVKVVVKFSNRNLYDYINSECGENIFLMVRLFPNVLIVMAGVCLVCNNVWFALQSPTLEQFTDLLQQCYKYSVAPPNETPPKGTPGEPAAQEDRNRLKIETKNLMKKFKDDLKKNDNTSLDLRSLTGSYFIVFVIQMLVVLAIISVLVWLMADEMNTRYECKIHEKIPDLVYDTFLCSYSISKFYLFSGVLFLCFMFADLVFSIIKYIQLKKIDFTKVNYKYNTTSRTATFGRVRKDLGFLVNLVKLSNLPYLKPFCETYNEPI